MRATVIRCLAALLCGLLMVSAVSAVSAANASAGAEAPVVVGSKRFVESYVLGEILAQAVEAGGPVVRRPGLGNTGVLIEALRHGAIDVYPEYTGTIAREILHRSVPMSLNEINAALAPLGLAAGVPLGFENSYALAVPAATAERLHLATIADLGAHPELRIGLSQEFIARRDGWQSLVQAYGLTALRARGLDHGLAYAAAGAGQVDVIDAYTTDPQIDRYGLRLLGDDRRVLPSYDAVLLYRADLPARHPRAWRALNGLAGRIDAQRMRAMNETAEHAGGDFAGVARQFLGAASVVGVPAPARTRWFERVFAEDFWRLAIEHLRLVAVSLVGAVLAGVPLGFAAQRLPRVRPLILSLTGLIQTLPSLALLAFLIAVYGRIGAAPAITALFLYALLPIVRNTYLGFAQIAPGQREAAAALGLRPVSGLIHIELPQAARTILAGVKTSAVINVGTATIAALIGAGGFGERIAQGLALNDTDLLIAGALPSAGLALGMQFLFDWFERRFTFDSGTGR